MKIFLERRNDYVELFRSVFNLHHRLLDRVVL